jgi:hypothetical protein
VDHSIGKEGAMRSSNSRPGWLREGRRALAAAILATATTGCAGVLSGLEYVSQESALSSDPNKLAVAHCPPGKKVTGGGAHVGPQTPELALIRSTPAGTGEGWIAQAVEVSPFAFDWHVAATAICVKAAP